MQKPIAYKSLSDVKPEAYKVKIEPIAVNALKFDDNAPAIVVVRKAVALPDLEAGLIDENDIISISDGNWQNAVLVVTPSIPATSRVGNEVDGSYKQTGDELFLASIPKREAELVKLGQELLQRIRAAGIDGELAEKKKGRWVNSPINSFTLKIQPRKRDFQFTIYGNPETYDHGGFLRKDQNSYSRGWVDSQTDVQKLVRFAKEAHDRREAK